MIKEIEGDLIELAKKGTFDVICHGCNCFNRQKSGVAKQMAEAFKTNIFPLEDREYYGDINKLGQIDFLYAHDKELNKDCVIVNCYTQFKIAKFNNVDYPYTITEKPFDYQAFTLCMRKINHIFKGKHIGLPKIGSHLAGGNWKAILGIIMIELKDMEVTIVNLPDQK